MKKALCVALIAISFAGCAKRLDRPIHAAFGEKLIATMEAVSKQLNKEDASQYDASLRTIHEQFLKKTGPLGDGYDQELLFSKVFDGITPRQVIILGFCVDSVPPVPPKENFWAMPIKAGDGQRLIDCLRAIRPKLKNAEHQDEPIDEAYVYEVALNKFYREYLNLLKEGTEAEKDARFTKEFDGITPRLVTLLALNNELPAQREYLAIWQATEEHLKKEQQRKRDGECGTNRLWREHAEHELKMAMYLKYLGQPNQATGPKP